MTGLTRMEISTRPSENRPDPEYTPRKAPTPNLSWASPGRAYGMKSAPNGGLYPWVDRGDRF